MVEKAAKKLKRGFQACGVENNRYGLAICSCGKKPSGGGWFSGIGSYWEISPHIGERPESSLGSTLELYRIKKFRFRIFV